MLYPAQAVDGIVHQLGGLTLLDALQAEKANGHDEVGQPIRCPEGGVVITSNWMRWRIDMSQAGRPLANLPFDLIAHTVPPFWHGDKLVWAERLLSCYISSLNAVTEKTMTESPNLGAEEVCIASPLLGAGARGAPAREAADVAVSALTSLLCGALDAEESSAGGAPLFVHGPVSHLRFRFVLQHADVFGEVCDAIERDLGSAALARHRARVEPCTEHSR